MIGCVRQIVPWARKLNFTISKRNLSSSEIYSKIIPGDERIRVWNPQCDWTDEPIGSTVYEVFHTGWRKSGNGPCLGTRSKKTGKYEWIDYQRTCERSLNAGSGFQEFGVPSGQNSFIGINCKNSNEFVISYLGASSFSSVIVPLYDHLSGDAVNHIVSLTELQMFIADTEEKANYIISQKSNFPKLKTLVTTWHPSKELLSAGRAAQLEIVNFSFLEGVGQFKQRKAVRPKPEDLFAICWTSGTSGMPKGALITHNAFTTTVNAGLSAKKPLSFDKTVCFSFMPTGHIYELIIELQTIGQGGSLGFFGGDIANLMDDIKTLKPTVLPMVPRILNRLYRKCVADINKNPLKRMLFKTALRSKENQIKRGIVSNKTIWDKLVFDEVHELFGGQIDMIISSAAPLSAEVFSFYRSALGCYLFNGYGQTESGAITVSSKNDFVGDNVGAPVPEVDVKLIDVPEMGYYAKDDIGEICARGTNIIKSYYRNEPATKEAIHNEWLHTGDIGKWMPNGTLKLVDRKSNLFKLSQGEYLSPEKVENTYIRHKLVSQVYIDGQSDKDYLIAIVMPDPENFLPWAKHKGFKSTTMEELCKDKEVRLQLLSNLRKLGKKSGLSGLEQAKNVYLNPTLLSIEEGFLTPTLKMKRKVIKKHFAQTIRNLYDEVPLIATNQ